MVHFTSYPTAPGSTMEGLPLAFVLEACFLVAGNKAGVLQAHSTGEGFWPAEGDEDKLLGTGDYYFWVKSGEYVINMFSILQKLVPPLTIPTRWAGGLYRAGDAGENTVHGSGASAAVKWLDKTCIVTGATTALQASHIVPKSEREWFGVHHQLFASLVGQSVVHHLNSARNMVSLRVDLNMQGFDQGHFVFAPYRDKMVMVCVQDTAGDLAHQYHLREIRFPRERIPGCYQFTRFAWNVFKFSAPHLGEIASRVGELPSMAPPPAPVPSPPKRPHPGPSGDRHETGGEAREDEWGGTSSKEREQRGNSTGGGGGGGRSGNGAGEEDWAGGGASLGTEDWQSDPRTLDDNPVSYTLSCGPRTSLFISAETNRTMKAGSFFEQKKAMLPVLEALDETLKDKELTVDDERAGLYYGFSKVRRMELDYRAAHPQVSAVVNADVWEPEEVVAWVSEDTQDERMVTDF
ncbi:hypothetical protein K438DRAFT_1953397 [Mycena galopus ATCC 62051]|nr:hypothetical protein K438DRAFT_1953397 [Mycena galopus ATCC 62051]